MNIDDIILSPKDSFKIWNFSNLRQLKPNFYEGYYNNEDFKIYHQSYTTYDNYHVSLQTCKCKNYNIVDIRRFDLSYMNFVYLIDGAIDVYYHGEDIITYQKDDWIVCNSKFNIFEKSYIRYHKNKNTKLLHITVLSPLLKYYLDFDTIFSDAISSEINRNSQTSLLINGKYNTTIRELVKLIIKSVNTGPIGDKTIQLKIDELFLLIIPSFITSKGNDIEKINQYIKGNFHKKITIDKLAKQFKVSTYFIKEGLKKRNSITFAQYLKLVRLEKALELYSNNKNLSFSQISKKVGYTNASRLKNDLFDYMEDKKDKLF